MFLRISILDDVVAGLELGAMAFGEWSLSLD